MNLAAITRRFSASEDAAPHWYTDKWQKKLRIDRDISGFSSIANSVAAEGKTYLGLERLYTLWQVLIQSPVNVIHVEVGVYRGGSAKFISEALSWRQSSSILYACDTFSGHAEIERGKDGRHQIGDFSGVDRQEVAAYLSERGNVQVVVGSIMEKADEIPNGSIGLLHIDVDVYPATKFCLDRFSSRVCGAIVVDDYGFTTCPGVKEAVDEFIAAHSGWKLFHLLSGQALLVP